MLPVRATSIPRRWPALNWSLGVVNYYTDQGDLSPILPNAAANTFVASAFLQWTSVSTAAVVATLRASWPKM